MTMSIAVQQLKREKRRMRYEFLDTELAQCGNERGPASSDHNQIKRRKCGSTIVGHDQHGKSYFQELPGSVVYAGCQRWRIDCSASGNEKERR